MKQVPLPFALIGIGVALIAASLAVPQLLGGRMAWNDQMAEKYQQASLNYHEALHAHQGADQDPANRSLDAARQQFIEQQSALNSAQNRGYLLAGLLRWIGILGAAAGVILHVINSARD